MYKIAAENISAVATRSAHVLRELVRTNQDLQTKVASLEGDLSALRRERRIEKIAQAMEEKGLNPDLSLDEKLSKLGSHPDLDRIEEVVNMASSVGNIRIASTVSDMPGRTLSAQDSFANFCIHGSSDSES